MWKTTILQTTSHLVHITLSKLSAVSLIFFYFWYSISRTRIIQLIVFFFSNPWEMCARIKLLSSFSYSDKRRYFLQNSVHYRIKALRDASKFLTSLWKMFSLLSSYVLHKTIVREFYGMFYAKLCVYSLLTMISELWHAFKQKKTKKKK